MKNLYTFLFLSLFYFTYADTGIYESYLILQNGQNLTYYDGMSDTNNPDFNNNNLGTFNLGDTFLLKGAEIKTWKNNGSNVTGAKVFYKIYPENTPSTNFSHIDLNWAADLGGGNQKWEKTNADINLLEGLSAGNYTIEVYFMSTTNNGDVLDNNNGNNYKANFSIINSDLILNNGKVVVSPKKPSRAESITITLDANGTALENAEKIYLHAGIGTNNPQDTGFSYTIGHWGQDDSVGLMNSLGNNLWEIEISINAYFNLPENEDAFNLNFLFRNADGSKKEDFNGNNYTVTLESGPYFLIDSPTLSPHLVEMNQNFEIKAHASSSTSWELTEINAQGDMVSVIHSNQVGENYTYSHSISDTDLHYFKLKTDFNGIIKHKTILVQGYSAPTQSTLPQGAKKGINYNFPNAGEVTLVLHTPTSTTYQYYDPTDCAGTTSTSSTPAKQIIHLLGDFNHWQIKEEYKLNKDGDYWWITLEPSTQFETPPKDEYVFQYLIDGEIRIADPYTHKASDPEDQHITTSTYPNLVSYPYGKAKGIASVLELNPVDYVWKVPNFERKYERNNLNIYELHFRDFTSEGTFKAATAKLDYLKDLGINTIHVMPISEFEGNNSWGYNPNYYFAVDKTYGTANDLKEFIDEAHLRGIAVVNDLVLNHAFYTNPNAKMYWDKTNNRPAADNPWFNAEHKAIASQDGHWGADWNHASEHTQQMVDDILKYWITEFKFDGFRFDFTKGFSQKDPNPSDPWASNYDVCRVALLKRMVDKMWSIDNASIEHYAIFEHLANDEEDRDLANHGILMWSGSGPQDDWIKMAEGNGIRGFEKSLYSTRGFNFPNYMSYMESHDEERIGYQVKEYGAHRDGTTAYLSNRLKLVAAFNLLMPGPRMVWQFGELGYDISINENGRTGDKPSAWELGYDTDTERKEIYRLYSHLLQFRNKYNLYDNNGFDFRNNHNNTTDWARTMSGFDSSENVQVISIGNFDAVHTNTVHPGYFTTGTWYKYNGDPTVDGTPYQVTNKNANYTLYTNDPVYVLSNADIIPPVFHINPITIETDYCQYQLEDEYIVKKGEWSQGNTTLGHVADNSGALTLKIVKINNEVVNLPNLDNFYPKNGENLIEWEATDSAGNTTQMVQSITIERGACYKPAANGSSLKSDILISTLNRAQNNLDTTKQNGILVLESKKKGLSLSVIPLGSDISLITNPVNGMIVMDENDNCLKLYDGNQWSCIQQKALPKN